jgi:hypothetical protein
LQPTPRVGAAGLEQVFIFNSVSVQNKVSWSTGLTDDITQAATACAQLQYRNEQFMQELATQGQELLQPSQPGALSPKQHLGAATAQVWLHSAVYQSCS